MLRARSGCYSRVHMAPPAGTFGALARLGKRTTRQCEQPLGDGSVGKENEANNILRVSCDICVAAAGAGAHICFEIPTSSFIEKVPFFQEMVRAAGLYRFETDLCEFGCGPPDAPDSRYRRRIVLFSNDLRLLSLKRTCAGNHVHTRCRGGVRIAGRLHRRSTLAADNPPAFCEAYGAAISGPPASTGPHYD